nr:phage regulatory CII family protein [Rhizobium halophytocola]
MKASTEAAYTLGGGVTAFPLMTRVNVSTLSKYASFNDEYAEKLIPIDVAIEADRRAKSPVILSAMAQVLSYQLVPLASRAQLAAELSESDALLIMDEATDLWRLARAAFADGRIDGFERRELLRKLRQLMRAVHFVIDKLSEEG